MNEVVSTAFHYTELSSKNLKNVIAPNSLRIKTNKKKQWNRTAQKFSTDKLFCRASNTPSILLKTSENKVHFLCMWRIKLQFFHLTFNRNFQYHSHLDHLFWGFHSLSWQSLITFSEYKKKKKGFQHRLRTGLLTSDV